MSRESSNSGFQIAIDVRPESREIEVGIVTRGRPRELGELTSARAGFVDASEIQLALMEMSEAVCRMMSSGAGAGTGYGTGDFEMSEMTSRTMTDGSGRVGARALWTLREGKIW